MDNPGTTSTLDFTQPGICYSLSWGMSPEAKDVRAQFSAWVRGLSDADVDYWCGVYTARHFGAGPAYDRRWGNSLATELKRRHDEAHRAALVAAGKCPNKCFNGWIRHMGSDYPCGHCH